MKKGSTVICLRENCNAPVGLITLRQVSPLIARGFKPMA
jgi:hypothetical protein